MNTTVENKYRFAFSRSRPQHERCDDFSIRHPKMQMSQRAKIFSPYSALKGFEELIDNKGRIYVEKRELNEDEQHQLDLTLNRLYEWTRKLPAARDHPIIVQATVYVPCTDENHEAYGCRGSYETISGIVRHVDPILTMSLMIGERRVDFADISAIIIQKEC